MNQIKREIRQYTKRKTAQLYGVPNSNGFILNK